MPTRKIEDLTPTKHRPCMHPEHDPAMHMVYTNGVYEHTCPACGHVQTFTVMNPTMSWSSGGSSDRMWSAAC